LNGRVATNCATENASFEKINSEFYPDPEILSNGAGLYTKVIYDVTETEDRRRGEK
jgi:transposase